MQNGRCPVTSSARRCRPGFPVMMPCRVSRNAASSDDCRHRFRSIPSPAKRHPLAKPEAVTRMRLQLSQKWPEIGVMIPMRTGRAADFEIPGRSRHFCPHQRDEGISPADPLQDLASAHAEGVPPFLPDRRHVFDEADRVPLLEGQRGKVEELVVIHAPHDHHIDLDRRESRPSPPRQYRTSPGGVLRHG